MSQAQTRRDSFIVFIYSGYRNTYCTRCWIMWNLHCLRFDWHEITPYTTDSMICLTNVLDAPKIQDCFKTARIPHLTEPWRRILNSNGNLLVKQFEPKKESLFKEKRVSGLEILDGSLASASCRKCVLPQVRPAGNYHQTVIPNIVSNESTGFSLDCITRFNTCILGLQSGWCIWWNVECSPFGLSMLFRLKKGRFNIN